MKDYEVHDNIMLRNVKKQEKVHFNYIEFIDIDNLITVNDKHILLKNTDEKAIIAGIINPYEANNIKIRDDSKKLEENEILPEDEIIENIANMVDLDKEFEIDLIINDIYFYNLEDIVVNPNKRRLKIYKNSNYIATVSFDDIYELTEISTIL